MHGITRAARRGLRAAIALAIALMLGALFAIPAAADPAPGTPADPAPGTPAAPASVSPGADPAAGSSLGLGLQLLGMSVKLNVLPLDLTQLVTIDAASSAPASPPTTSTSVPRPPVTTPVGQPTGSRPASPSSSTAPNANANGGNPGSAASNAPPSTANTTPPPATVTKTAPPRKPRAQGSLKLVKGLLPHTSAMLLIVLILGTTLAVALMVRFGAQQGGRRA